MGLANPPAQMEALRQSDLLVVLGAQLSDITTQGYTFPTLVRPDMTMVHVHSDPAAIGTHFTADLAIASDPLELLAAVGAPERQPDGARADWIDRLKARQRAIAAPRRLAVGDGLAFERVVEVLAHGLPADAIVTADAGTFAAPVYRVVPFAPPQRLLAPIAGAMGFGVPAAVAAALREPGRPVICLVGDGGFLMTGNELAVALERGLRLKVILSENGIYGSIRIHQERDYPGRTVGTSFRNPDFALIGRAFGMTVTRLASDADLDRLPDLLAAPESSLIVVATSVEAILPRPGNAPSPALTD
jgi:acetolactate synthase-1/2/3 large subunit